MLCFHCSERMSCFLRSEECYVFSVVKECHGFFAMLHYLCSKESLQQRMLVKNKSRSVRFGATISASHMVSC